MDRLFSTTQTSSGNYLSLIGSADLIGTKLKGLKKAVTYITPVIIVQCTVKGSTAFFLQFIDTHIAHAAITWCRK